MKKLDSVQQTLIDMGFVIDEKNENYVLDEVSIPATEIIGYTAGSFLEKAKRRGWLHEEQVGVGKPMLLQPGMIFGNNVAYGNSVVGVQIDAIRHIAYRNWSLGMWIDPDAEDEATKSKVKPVVGTHTMGIRTVETPPEPTPKEEDKTWDPLAVWYGFWTSVD